MFQVKRAERQRRPLKVCLEGLSGSGKTYTMLRLLFTMRRLGIGSKIAIADSENDSASLYAGVHIDGETWQYDVCPIPRSAQNPAGYAAVYDHLAGEGYDLIGIDSMSHAWHGALEQVDKVAARSGRNDKHSAWAEVTPEQRRMLDTLTDGRAHCVATMRVKSEYERIEEGGKTKIRKVGLKVDQRDNTEYEFDLVLRLDQDHNAIVEKVRGCSSMDRASCLNPGPDFFKPLFDWWKSGAPVKPIIDTHLEAINSAKSLEELKIAFASAWNDQRITADDRAKVTTAKNDAKAKLSAPPHQRQPGEDDMSDYDAAKGAAA